MRILLICLLLCLLCGISHGQQSPTIDKTKQGNVSPHTWENADQSDQKIAQFAQNIYQPLTVQMVKDTFQSTDNSDDMTISYQRLRMAGAGTFWQATFGVPGVWIDLRTSVRGSYATNNAPTGQDYALAGVTYNDGKDITYNITYINTLPDSYDIIHAHGVTARNWRTDGVAFLTDMPMAPMESRTYTYTVPWNNSGTYFIHSHWSFNALSGVNAPLVIVTDAPQGHPNKTILDDANLVDAVMFLEDWCLQMTDSDDSEGANTDTTMHREPYICQNPMLSFRAMWGEWNGDSTKKHDQTGDLDNREKGIDFPSCEDAIDGFEFNFAYFLANGREYKDSVSRKLQGLENVRLRIINAGALTTYRVQFPTTLLNPEVIAVDGHYITPTPLPADNTLWIAVGQRLDVLFKVPNTTDTSYQIIAIQETANPTEVNNGDNSGVLKALANPGYSGIALYKGNALLKTIPNIPDTPGLLARHPQYILQQESSWHALDGGLKWSLRDATRNYTLDLNGYNGIRGINGADWMLPPIASTYSTSKNIFRVRHEDRVCLKLHNWDHEVHPIHLHGHTFQVIAINDTLIDGGGAWRDTVQVPVCTTVHVCFNALAAPDSVHHIHCHMVIHEMSGMQAIIAYEDYSEKSVPYTYTGALDAYTKGFNQGNNNNNNNNNGNGTITNTVVNNYNQASNTSDLTKTGLGVGLALGLSLLLSWIFFGCAFYRYSQQHHYGANINMAADGRGSVSAPAGKHPARMPSIHDHHQELDEISHSQQQ